MNKKLISTAAACGAIMTYALAITVTGPVLDSIREHLNTDEGSIGLLFTFLSAGFLLSVLLKGSLLRLLDIKTTALLAQFLILVTLAAFPFTEKLWQALSVFFLMGAAGGLIQVSANTAVSMLYEEKRVMMLNVLHLFFGAGALSGPLIAGSLPEGVGIEDWGPAFWVVAAFALPVLILQLSAGYPDFKEDKKKSPGPLVLFKDSFTWFLFLTMVLYVGAEMGINSWSVLYLEKNHDLPRMSASSYLSWFWFLMTAGRLLGIYLAARFRTSLLLTLFSFLATGAAALFSFAPDGSTAGFGLALIGFFFAGTYPFLIGLGGNRHPGAVEDITTLMIAAAASGFMIFPWLTGVIGEMMALQTGIVMIAGVIALMIISSAMLMLLENRNQS